MDEQTALPEKGLRMPDPWASLIVEGKKTWEMRSRPTNIRGRVAILLAGDGGGVAIGTAEIIDCIGPVSREEAAKALKKHRVPLSHVKAGLLDGHYAWVIGNVEKFAEPVPYRQPKGGGAWVNLAGPR